MKRTDIMSLCRTFGPCLGVRERPCRCITRLSAGLCPLARISKRARGQYSFVTGDINIFMSGDLCRQPRIRAVTGAASVCYIDRDAQGCQGMDQTGAASWKVWTTNSSCRQLKLQLGLDCISADPVADTHASSSSSVATLAHRVCVHAHAYTVCVTAEHVHEFM